MNLGFGTCDRCGATREERKLYHVTDDINSCGVCRPWLAQQREAEAKSCVDCSETLKARYWLGQVGPLCKDCHDCRKVVDGSSEALDFLEPISEY